MSKPEDRDLPEPMVFPSQLARGKVGGRPKQGHAAGERAPTRRPAAPSSGLRLRLEEPDRPAAAVRWFVCREEGLTIGRSAACELQLADEQRVVSGRHARIVRRGERFELVDLGSKNLTYLNGEPLEPDQPRDLAPGDLIEIGAFAIAVLAADEEPATPVAGDTVLEPEFVNPFAEPAAELAGVLARIAELYDGEPAGRRDAALREALQEALGPEPDRATLAAVGRLLERLGGPEPPA